MKSASCFVFQYQKIAGISQLKGLFDRDTADGGYLLMPYETLKGIVGGKCNLIVSERIKILGILRSVGGSRRRTNRILITESMVIGAIGGFIGCILGVGVLYVIKSMFFSANTDIEESRLVFGLYEVILTIIASVILTVLSAMLPLTIDKPNPFPDTLRAVLHLYSRSKICGRWVFNMPIPLSDISSKILSSSSCAFILIKEAWLWMRAF